MIKNDMKVGDTFEDNGRTFKVDSIVPEGYITHSIDPEDTKPEEKKATRGRKASKE